MKRLLPPGLFAPRLLPPLALPLPLLLPALLLPLLLTVAPLSPLAHDAGYYSLQARWIHASGSWLAPLWFGQPLFDRCIGTQWLMALSLQLFGGQAWAVELPSRLAAALSLALTGWLAQRLLPIAASPSQAAIHTRNHTAPASSGSVPAGREADDRRIPATATGPSPSQELPPGPNRSLPMAPGSRTAVATSPHDADSHSPATAAGETVAQGPDAVRRRLALLAMAVLALTPLWINHAHLATQDMPLLAVELAGVAGLVASDRRGRGGGALLAGLAPGLAFLIKGFMVALPVLAVAPYLLLERRWLLRRPCFWLGLALGCLPVLLWLGLSIQAFGLPVVAGLWTKLLFLSRSDAYAAGPLYYLWNLPANTAPWIGAALAGWPLLWRSPLQRSQRLLLLLYPLLLLLLLSAFRTKTPYYGLQLTPWIALAAALALERWSASLRALPRRLDRLIALLGALLLLAAALALWPGSPLHSPLAAAADLPPAALLAGAAASLGLAWLLLPLQPTPPRRLLALLLGPWLALVLLTQAGLFSDRSPAVRRLLESAPVQALLRQGPLPVVAATPLNGEEHDRLILIALATAQPPDPLLSPAAVPTGQPLWIRRGDLGDPRGWRLLLDDPALSGWLLAKRLPPPPDATP
jgi:4-amino-4-deoxy-L-arabinose transferase-like glycosyltransferase